MNICGVLVHCAPGQTLAVRSHLNQISGVEIHAQTDDDRLIVTAEDTDQVSAGDAILSIHRTPGVISAALTFHSFEELSDEQADSNPITH